MQEFLGVTEIARLLGLTRQRVHQLIREPGFPQPVARLALGGVWRTQDILNWIRDYRPDLARPEPLPP